MATICLACGSERWDNAFVYCTECLEVAVHRYCLDIIPRTLDEFVSWVCEDCEKEIPPSTKKRRGYVSMKKRNTGPTDAEEKITEDGPSHGNSHSSSSMEKKLESRLVDNTYDYEQGHLIHCSSNNGTFEKLQTCSDHEEKSRLICNTEYNSDVGDISNPRTAPTQIRQDHHIPAEPVEDPIWRGDFVIINKNLDTCDGFVAHLSNKACSKVCEEARLLKTLLHLEMHPKSDVWPKSFLNSDPSDENIALYFFPEDTSEGVFGNLVQYMMENELALKATVENAELLLFTSVELPLLYWSFKGKKYLWGVFRGKQGARSEQKKIYDGAKCLDPAIDEGTATKRKTRSMKSLRPVMQGVQLVL